MVVQIYLYHSLTSQSLPRMTEGNLEKKKELRLWPSEMWSASKLSQMHAIVNCVGAPTANSCHRYLCTSHIFSNFQYHFKIIWYYSNDKQFTAIFFVLPFNKMALAFTRLAPSFGRISHYTPFITFLFNLFNFNNINRYPLLRCV
jgi:hypothetical protein